MIPYILVFILLLYFSFRYDLSEKKTDGKRSSEIIMLIVLICFAGLRNRVGSDTIDYMDDYEMAPTLTELLNNKYLLEEIIQPLWAIFMSFCKTISESFVLFQFAHAILFNLLLFNFVKHTTNKVFLFFLFFYCIDWWNYSFEILRESLCVVIFLNALSYYFRTKKILVYIGICIPALLIHWMAFVPILITPLCFFIKDKKLILFMVLIGASFFLWDTSSLNNLIMMAAFSSESTTRIADYMDSDRYGANSVNIIGLIIVLVVYILLPLLIYRYKKKSDTDNALSRLMPFYILIAMVGIKMPIINRLLHYYQIPLLVLCVNCLFSNTANNTFRRNDNLVRVTCIMLLLLNTFLSINTFYKPSQIETRGNVRYNAIFIPYTTVFEDPDPIREGLY